ncbi:hypothetical protein V6N13_110790 [Hibiscus sabdariffa]|uniref:DUF4216 domain-containing protein n=1 Tax=Hibiscus sabdariffa TaxID=183260 RepID=A0ABR2TI84_9ROSI
MFESNEYSDDELASESEDGDGQDRIHDMVFDFGRATENFTRKFNAHNVDDPIEGSSNASGEINETINDPNSEAIKFYRLLQEVEQNADWWDVYHKAGFKEDKFGFSMINVKRRLRTEEPYVLASQAEQVYYVKDIKDLNWQVAVKTKPRDLYDLPCEDVREEPCQENEELGFRFQEFNVGNDDDDDLVSLDRPQLGSTHIERSLVNLDVIIGVEDEGDESDHDEFTSINNEDDELESINDVDAYNDDDDDD